MVKWQQTNLFKSDYFCNTNYLFHWNISPRRWRGIYQREGLKYCKLQDLWPFQNERHQKLHWPFKNKQINLKSVLQVAIINFVQLLIGWNQPAYKWQASQFNHMICKSRNMILTHLFSDLSPGLLVFVRNSIRFS